MPVTVSERYLGRRGDDTGRTLSYIVRGTDSDETASAETYTASPAVHEGFARRSVNVTQIAPEIWETTVTYSDVTTPQRPTPETGDVTYSFATTTQNARFTTSKETITSSVVLPFALPDFQQAINVQEDGTVQGADVLVPTSTFRYSLYHPVASVDQTYIDGVNDLVGKTNDATFKGRAAGEVLLTAVNGQQRDTNDFEITFDFGFRKNETNIAVGDIAVFDKKGWELVWYTFRKTRSGNRIIAVPLSAHVERVYDSGSFSALGIGT